MEAFWSATVGTNPCRIGLLRAVRALRCAQALRCVVFYYARHDLLRAD